jgi:hypothetical protein
MLDRFDVVHGGGSPVVSRWLGAVLHLFQPEIAGLLRDRDSTIMGWRRRRRSNVFEDPRLEIPSSLDIDLEERLAAAPVRQGVPPSLPRLPRMAEGWGV